LQREFDHQLREHVGDPLMYAPSQKLSVISEGKVLFRWSCGEDFEFFDLASLTKILFSAPLWVRLLQHSSLDVKDEARVYLPWWKNGDGVTVEQLLIHSSGLTWWKPFFKKIKEGSLQKRREQLIELLKKEVPENPGQVCMYSDLSLFYLGLIAEEVFQKSLMDLWLETKAQMGYESLHFQKANQLSHKKSSYAPTGFSEWREKELQGEVHDDNAWSFGGVAPHAGLFGGLEDLENYLLESGVVKGIKGVEPPLRLAFLPFLSSYTSFSRDEKTFSTYNGGMDIKYGVNEAFTLDVTLLPDFGQVVFDKQVLNISPFEIQFNENRQFFTEGTELFNKSGIFYSRRIGVQTSSTVYENQLDTNEELKEVPSSVPLINASKISGRMKNGLGIGIFNGITAEQTGKAIRTIDGSDHSIDYEREITISPLTNYNVIVLDQNLKNNSYINFTNTNVLRQGGFYDANVSSINTSINSKNNDYFIDGEFILSNIISDSNNLGHSWGAEIGKQRGQLTCGIEYYEESDTYDPNDLGFLRANNSRVMEAYIGYRNFNPNFWNLNKYFTSFSIENERLYAPNLFGSTSWRASGTMISRSFNATGIRMNGTIGESNDYFEPRGDIIGEDKFIRPVWTNFRGWFSSNYQKKIMKNYLKIKIYYIQLFMISLLRILIL